MHVNLSAYDDVENLDRFDAKSFASYCDGKFAGCDKHIAFIKKHCAGKSWTGKVCEIGSGNSKLLYRLEKEGLLKEGFGYEISRSRHLFAEKFKSYIKSTKVENRNNDIFKAPPLQNMDIILMVDIVFQLFGPLFPSAERDIISWIKNSLKKNGLLLMELMDFNYFSKCIELSKEKEFRWWEKFPAHDPFEFVLAEISLDKNKDIVWKKQFFRRNSTERSDFVNVIRPYSPKKITAFLKKAGFSAEIFPYWKKSGDIDEGGYLVLAKKK